MQITCCIIGIYIAQVNPIRNSPDNSGHSPYSGYSLHCGHPPYSGHPLIQDTHTNSGHPLLDCRTPTMLDCGHSPDCGHPLDWGYI
jgi:hypothetical protein